MNEKIASGPIMVIWGIARSIAIVLLVLILAPLQFLVLLFNSHNAYFLPQIFHRLVCKVLGIKIRTHGVVAVNGPVLYISNHTSYLDVMVLGSVLRASFIAKSEVERWPLFGMLSKLQQTVFVVRRRMQAAEQSNKMREMLKKGNSLILFPEGTSSDGLQVLPFKSSLFSIAEVSSESEKPIMIQPVTVVCVELGGLPLSRAWRPYYSWFGDMTLLPHLWRVLKLGRFTVDVTFYPPVVMKDFHSRKDLAAYCHKVIAQGVERILAGRRIS